MSKPLIYSANPKIPLIIDATLAIIREHGDQGLSMRKVAASCNMSLSNLQYYFKNKDELLKGAVDVYCDKCTVEYEEFVAGTDFSRAPELVRAMVEYGMYMAESGKSAVYRELWTIGARNQDVQDYLVNYYRSFIAELTQRLSRFTATPTKAAQAASLAISFFEGYSNVGTALPLGRNDVADFMESTLLSLLANDTEAPRHFLPEQRL